MRAIVVAVAVAVGLSAFPVALRADEVHLDDGRVLRGKVVEENDEKVVVEGKFGRVEVDAGRVVKIVRGETPAPAPETPPAPEKPPPAPETSLDGLIRRYIRGERGAEERLLARGEKAYWRMWKFLREAEEQAVKVRLRRLINRLSEVDDESAERAEETYEAALAKESEWEKEYERARKAGKSDREAVRQTVKELAEAISLYQKAVGANRLHYQARVRLGVLYYRAHLYKKILKKVLDTLEGPLAAEDPYAVRTVAAIRLARREYGKTLSVLKPLIKKEDPDALQMAVQAALNLRKFTEARRYLKPLKKKRPDDYKTLAYEGMLEMVSKHMKRAVELLRKAIEAGDTSGATRFNLAVALSKTGKKAEAEKVLRGMRKDFPHDVSVVLLLARLLVEQGRKGEAESALERYIEENPKGKGRDAARKALLELRRKH